MHGKTPTPLTAALFLAALTLAAFFHAPAGGFVSIDDPDYVVANPHVNGGLSGQALGWALTHTHHGHWYPLTLASHMLDSQLYGLSPAGHHLTGILLHAASVIVLFLALLKMTGAFWASAFTAAIFAAHPLQAESVAWISERKNVLSGFFWMLTLLAYARYAQRKTRARYGLVFAAYAGALMAKPILVTLPLLLLLLDYWPLRRRESFKRLALEKAPLLTLAAALGSVSLASSKIQSLEALPVSLRLANAALSCGRYLEKIVWPSGLAAYYPFGEPQAVLRGGLAACLLLVLAAAGAWRARRKHPYLIVGGLWFLLALVPVIGLIQVGGQSMADRYAYLPIIGVALALAWWAPAVWPWSRDSLIAAGAGIVSIMVVATSLQVRHWRDSVALFTRAVTVVERNCLAHDSLAMALIERGDLSEAEARLRLGIEDCPRDARLRGDLAFALALQSRMTEAGVAAAAALAIDPESGRQKNLSLVLGALKKSGR